jgi:aspartate/methionine/tyrosine aminotransferase
VDVPLDEVFDVSVVDRYRQALVSSSVPVRAILVTNPHNPLGRCFPKEVLEALIQFCLDGNLHYISDEVYATSTHHSREEWKNHTHAPYHPFISALSLVSPDSAASKLVHVVYSLSKDFGVSGLRIVGFTSLLHQMESGS